MSGENAKVHMRQGGNDLHLASGGKMSADVGAATMSSNAATLSQIAGKVTSEALTTAAGSAQALVLTNTLVEAADLVLATIIGGTSTTGSAELKAVPTAHTITFTLTNRHASAAFNGTFIISFLVIKQN